jgi:hypothetical protein
MGTGIVVQNLHNSPYHGAWMDRLAYCFWVSSSTSYRGSVANTPQILTIILFLFFSTMTTIRAIRFPKLTARILQDFGQTSYAGAIPISLLSILVGIPIFYHQHPSAVWVAYGLWWISVAMSILVGCAIVFVSYVWDPPLKLESVNGV